MQRPIPCSGKSETKTPGAPKRSDMGNFAPPIHLYKDFYLRKQYSLYRIKSLSLSKAHGTKNCPDNSFLITYSKAKQMGYASSASDLFSPLHFLSPFSFFLLSTSHIWNFHFGRVLFFLFYPSRAFHLLAVKGEGVARLPNISLHA